VDVGLSKKRDPPFTPEVVEALIVCCKLSIMDQIIDEMKKTYTLLRTKIKGLKINDFGTGLLIQLSTGDIAMKFTKMLAGELDNECKSREIDNKKFLEQAFPYLSGDINIIFELENYYGLKVKEEEDLKAVDLELARKYYNKTVEYSKMLIEGKVSPQNAMIFPTMMGHFLFNEFGVYGSQMAEYVSQYIEKEDQEFDDNFIRLLFKEIYFSERGRKAIFDMVQVQMEMMAQLMGGGGMPPMDPSMMGGQPPNMAPPNGNQIISTSIIPNHDNPIILEKN